MNEKEPRTRIKTIVRMELPMRTSLKPSDEATPHRRFVESIRSRVFPDQNPIHLAIAEEVAHRVLRLDVVGAFVEDARFPVKLRI